MAPVIGGENNPNSGDPNVYNDPFPYFSGDPVD